MFELSLFVKIALTLFFVFVAIILSILIVRWLVRTLRVEADQFETLKLVNRGNSVCQYHLAVESPAPSLKFSLFADGIPLAPVYEEIQEEVVEEQTVVKEKAKSVSSVPVANTSEAGATKTEKPNADGALKAGKDVSVKSGVLANLLGTVGSILPGSLGSSMSGAAGKARKVQSTSAKAVQAPKSAQRKMESVQKSGGRLGVKADAAQDTGVAQPKAGARQMRSKREQVELSRSTRQVVKTITKTVEKIGFVQTVDINPGDALFLSLEISKQGKRYPTGSFAYSVESQPIPLNKQLGTASKMLKKRQVHFDPIPVWRYWMPSLSVSLYLVALALSAYYLFLFVWK